LIAECSKRVRIFKRVETAFAVCRELGADQFVVLLNEDEPVKLWNDTQSVDAPTGSD